MPIEVKYLDDKKGIEFILSGAIYGKDIIKTHIETHTLETISRLKYKIIDKTHVHQNYISADEVKSIADLDIQVARINPNIIIALIIPNELFNSLTSLWEAHVDGNFKHVKRFNCRDDANKWITHTLNQTERPK